MKFNPRRWWKLRLARRERTRRNNVRRVAHFVRWLRAELGRGYAVSATCEGKEVGAEAR
jgi:hypothetical protein